MSLSGTYGASNDEDGIAVIREALDRGITLLDTSDAYGNGHNEELVGKAIKGRRSDVVVATKFGNVGGRGGKTADGRPEYVLVACEASLKRLGVDVIDLYYQHRIDPDVPIEDTVGAMARLVEQGKVRALGLSEARPETIQRAHAVHPIAVVQNEFSLLYRAEAEETLKTTRQLKIGFVAYAPLGRGLMTGIVENLTGLNEADTRRGTRASPPKISGTTWRWPAASRKSRGTIIARSASWRWRGCWRRDRILFRFRVPRGKSGFSKISARLPSR
jgi:aryl-alcohol dehydrogenase-like predicted oxidoreductase